MIYAVMFEDDDSKAHMRSQHMPAHLAFLAANADMVRAAGPLLDGATDTPAGGLWLLEAADADAVQALVEADPFWPTGLRKGVRILAWRQVFADGERLI